MKILFIGDIFIDERVEYSAQLGAFIKEHDYVIGNLEAPIVPPKVKQANKAGPHLKHDRQLLKKIESLGVTHYCLANNHIMDYGAEGLKTTITALKGKTFGAALLPEEAYRPLILTEETEKLVFFNCTDHEFGISQGFDRRNEGSAWMDSNILKAELLSARENNNKTVLILHGGVEEISTPLMAWRESVREFSSFADLIICHHPHVIQGYEKYKNSEIYYSLGNFYFSTSDLSSENHGLMVSLSYEKEIFNTTAHEIVQKNGTIDLSKYNTIFSNRTNFVNSIASDEDILTDLWKTRYKKFLTLSLFTIMVLEPLEPLIKRTVLKKYLNKARLLLLLCLKSNAHRTAMIEILQRMSE